MKLPALISPFKGKSVGTRISYFSNNLKSVQKDVECTFGILKKRWHILEYRIHYHDIKTIEWVSLNCFVLHNMMADDTETQDNQSWVGHGVSLNQDAIYIWQPFNKESVQGSVAVSISVRNGMKGV